MPRRHAQKSLFHLYFPTSLSCLTTRTPGNLSYWTSWQTLKDHMAWLGDVEFCDVMVDRDGERAGWGLVRYKDKKNAKKAIDELSDSW